MGGRYGTLWLFLLLYCALWLGVAAQTNEDALPKSGGVFPKRDDDQVARVATSPMCGQADQILFDSRNNRVIAQGDVEIYYNNFTLTADRVVYDLSANELVAEGSVQLKNPAGAITRGDRLHLTDDYRDAFRNALVEPDNRECSEILKTAIIKTAPPPLILKSFPLLPMGPGR
jgi:lipopolysaccharide assembly outer membrane protein LptD (OstA)